MCHVNYFKGYGQDRVVNPLSLPTLEHLTPSASSTGVQHLSVSGFGALWFSSHEDFHHASHSRPQSLKPLQLGTLLTCCSGVFQ